MSVMCQQGACYCTSHKERLVCSAEQHDPNERSHPEIIVRISLVTCFSQISLEEKVDNEPIEALTAGKIGQQPNR